MPAAKLQEQYCFKWWKEREEKWLTFSPPQRNYHVTWKKMLAVALAVSHFRSYLHGLRIRLRTDLASLK